MSLHFGASTHKFSILWNLLSKYMVEYVLLDSVSTPNSVPVYTACT